jgi:uncharacterized membrane protein YoaK (UPF0700 family)
MPLNFLRSLSGRQRTARANRQLGALLALVAGAVNAGGFLAVHQYTSHMSGIVSSVADNLVLGDIVPVLAGLASLLFFLGGAACTAIMINWARHRNLHGEYSLSLVAEALLLLLFGVLGAHLDDFVAITVPLTVLLLCFIMGLQNAIMSKMSNSEIRTTHLTGVVTDLGIELGRMLYWNRSNRRDAAGYVHARWNRVAIQVAILSMFFVGGILGAIGFKHIGFATVLPFSLSLFIVALMPLLDDVRAFISARRE